MRSTPFFEPDLFQGVLGPSFAGKRPQTETEIKVFLNICPSQFEIRIDLPLEQSNSGAVQSFVAFLRQCYGSILEAWVKALDKDLKGRPIVDALQVSG